MNAHTRSIALSVFFLLAACSATPGRAAVWPNGMGLNGISVNGVQLNALTSNGLTVNGLTVNALNVNGIALNGLTIKGAGAGPITKPGIIVQGSESRSPSIIVQGGENRFQSRSARPLGDVGVAGAAQ